MNEQKSGVVQFKLYSLEAEIEQNITQNKISVFKDYEIIREFTYRWISCLLAMTNTDFQGIYNPLIK